MIENIAQILKDTAEAHNSVFKLTNGEDADWPYWYANHLAEHTAIDEILGVIPLKSELVYMLINLDRDFVDQQPNEPWELYYARALVDFYTKEPRDYSQNNNS